jgi:hypothetical protein
VSDPEVPTLADAAQAIVDWWDKQGTVVEPWQKIERLRAALGQREPDAPALDVCSGCGADVPEQCMCRGYELYGGSALATPEREPDTPACATCIDTGTVPHTGRGSDGFVRCPDCAAPDGGELDDLLADLNFLWKIPRDRDKAKAARDRLASALRSQRHSLREAEEAWDHWQDRYSRAQRELAEVRDTSRGDVLFEGVVHAYTGDRRSVMVAKDVPFSAGWFKREMDGRRVVVRAAEDKETPDED